MQTTLVQKAIWAVLCAGASMLGQTAGNPEARSGNTVSFINEGVIHAPIEDVWRVFSTSDGYTALGVAKADVDLRIGGIITSRYSPDGVLGDEQSIRNRILAYEPGRMMAIQIDRPPKTFPFKEAWKHTWTVITLTNLGNEQTHLRVASLGYGTDEESLAMRKFFEAGNAWTLKALQDHFAHSAAMPDNGSAPDRQSPSPASVQAH